MQRNAAFSLLKDEYMCLDETELAEARGNRRSLIKDPGRVGDNEESLLLEYRPNWSNRGPGNCLFELQQVQVLSL
jgi:hypothetical protein